MKRFQTTRAIALIIAAGLLSTVMLASAQTNYPTKPLTFVLSSGAGSSVDVMARTISKIAEKYLGEPIGVLNKPGGSGAVAMAYLLSNPANGYTIWAATKTFPVAMNTTLKQYSMNQFEPLVRVEIDPFTIAVQANSPYKTLSDLLKAAKAKPGSITVGGFGSSSPHHLATVRLMSLTNTKFTWVPFSAGSRAMAALLGGHVDAVLSNPSTLKQNVLAGKLRMLAVASDQRLKDFPDTPTFKELGVNLVDAQWRGIFLKAGTPSAVVAKLGAAFKKAIADPAFQTYLKKSNQEDGFMGPAAFTSFVGQQMNQIKTIVNQVGFGQ